MKIINESNYGNSITINTLVKEIEDQTGKLLFGIVNKYDEEYIVTELQTKQVMIPSVIDYLEGSTFVKSNSLRLDLHLSQSEPQYAYPSNQPFSDVDYLVVFSTSPNKPFNFRDAQILTDCYHQDKEVKGICEFNSNDNPLPEEALSEVIGHYTEIALRRAYVIIY